MAKREATRYQGVTVHTTTDGEKIFYIRYRLPGDKNQTEEKAGKASQGMTSAKAAGLRIERLNGKAQTNAQKRESAQTFCAAWTVSRLFEAYQAALPANRGRKTDSSNFKNIESIHKKTVPEIVTADVEKIRKELEKTKSLQTVKHAIVLLGRIISYGVKNGLIDAPSPKNLRLDKPKVDNKKTEVLTNEQLERLVAVLDDEKALNPGAVYMYIILLTGIRRSAALALTWDDIDKERMTIRLRGDTAKKGKTEYIPISQEVLDLVQLLPKADSPFLFPGKTPETHREGFVRAVDEIRKKAELPEGFRPLHGLRHNYASRLASSGQVDLYTLQRLLTHESPEMTARYAHLADEAMKRAAAVGASVILNAGKKEHSSDK